MKKRFTLIATLFVLMLASATASAHYWDDERYHENYHWRHTHHHDYDSERRLPFAWHDRYDYMREHHHLEPIYDREWHHRFPGLRAYRWSGHEGFWHHGHYVKDAVLFYNENDELVSVGYMADGVFIHFRDDHGSYENHDSFYFSWFHRS